MEDQTLDEKAFLEWINKIGGEYGVKFPEWLRPCFTKLLEHGLTMDEAGEIIDTAYHAGAASFGGG